MKRRLQVEELEGRTLMSATPIGPIPPVHQLPLAGSLAGTYTPGGLLVDAGVSDHLAGAGSLTGLGAVTAQGVLQGVGLMAQGYAGGWITLTGPQGTVTLGLRGAPLQGGFAPLPPHFYFHVLGGTGAFMHLAVSGTLDVQLQQAPGQAGPGGRVGGTFTLTIHPSWPLLVLR